MKFNAQVRDDLIRFDEFSENFRKGGGVTSDPKNFVVLFSLKEKGGSLHPEKFRCKKHNIVFPKIGWGGEGFRGRLEVFRKFIKSVRPSHP